MSTQNETASQRLQAALNTRLGDDWRAKVKVELSASDWYWVVRQLEEGLKATRARYRAEGGGQLDAASAASLGGFSLTIERIAAAVADNAQPPKKAKK